MNRSRSGVPGLVGYACAVAISLLTLAIELSVGTAFQYHDVNVASAALIVVLIFGCVPAAVLGTAGAVVVHFTTRNASTQWPAVLLAGAIGFAVPLSIGGVGGLGFATVLGVAAATGRAAVIPWSRERATTRFDPVAHARLIERGNGPLEREN